MKFLVKTLVIIFYIFTILNVKAEEYSLFNNIDYRLKAGVNLGASTPMPIPNRLSNLSWSPNIGPFIELSIVVFPDSNIGLSAGTKIEYKKMDVSASVYQLYSEVNIDNLLTKGYFTGTNETHLDVSYLTIPLQGIYKINHNLEFVLGFFASFSLDGNFYGAVKNGYIRAGDPTGERTDIEFSEFDFSDELRNLDWGCIGGINTYLTKKLYLNFQINLSLSSLLNTNFAGIPYKLYNLYSSLGLMYNI